MEKDRYDRLTAAGIQVEEAPGRFMNNEMLFNRFLEKFADDANYSLLKTAMAEGDAKGAFEAAHTLKGVAGNLSLERLYRAVEKQTEFLRDGRMDQASAVMPEVDAAYAEVTAALKK